MGATTAVKLMESEVVRDCVTNGFDSRDSNLSPSFSSPKIDEFNSTITHQGFFNSSQSSTWIQKVDAVSSKNILLSRFAKETEAESLGVDHGIASSSMASMLVPDGRTQCKVGEVPLNGYVSFTKLQMLQTEDLLPQSKTDYTKMEMDKRNMPLLKCSNTDKSGTIKQKSNINGRRADRKNYKVQMKGRSDPLSLKAGLPSCSPSSTRSNIFGMYGLKTDIHDVTKLIDDISLNELLDGSYKHPTEEKDKGMKATNLNVNILDSVRKACSVLRFQGLQQGKQSKEADVNAKNQTSLPSSPSSTGAVNSLDGDDGSLTVCLSKCSQNLESSKKDAVRDDTDHSPMCQPRHILERLSLPPPKDLDSLLQDALKPAASGKLTDSRYSKQLSHCVTLLPFLWSSNFNGHHKSNNDVARNTNKSTCHGRWVRLRSITAFIGSGGNEGYLDFESLSYDDSLVPVGQVKYRLPKLGKTILTSVSCDCGQQDTSSVACSTSTLPSNVLTAAQTLCDIARHWKHNGITRWPKQPSQKSMKSRKSRYSEKTKGEFRDPISETVHDKVARGVDSFFKKPKISVVERREVSNSQTVIRLCSISAPRSSRSSPIRLSKDSVAEAPSPFIMSPPLHGVLDRSNNHPQKLRKLGPADWNKTRS